MKKFLSAIMVCLMAAPTAFAADYPARDITVIENTPIDYLDFASPTSGIGSKIGFDATTKWPGETDRTWGRPIRMSNNVTERVDALWEELGID